MVRGLEEELRARMSGELGGPYGVTRDSPSVDCLFMWSEENSNGEDQPLEAAADADKRPGRKRRWFWKRR